MFRSKSKAEQAQDAVAEGAKAARAQAESAASTAQDKVADLKGAVSSLVDEAAPKLEAAREKAQGALDAAGPKVESARETIMDDVLPKVAAALATAAAGAASAKEQATEAAHRAPDAYAVLKGDAVAKNSGGKGKWLLLLGVVAAGVGYLAYKKSSEKQDPWATAGAYTPPSSGRDSSLGAKAANAAEAVKDKAAEVKAAAGAKAAEVKDAASAKIDEVKSDSSDRSGEPSSAPASGTPGLAAAEPLDSPIVAGDGMIDPEQAADADQPGTDEGFKA